jgi:hypothetical protein
MANRETEPLIYQEGFPLKAFLNLADNSRKNRICDQSGGEFEKSPGKEGYSEPPRGILTV